MTKFLKSSVACLFAVVILASCDQFKVTTDADGSKYQIHSTKDGNKKPKTGDIITINLKIKAPNDSTFKDTYKDGSPISIPLQKGNFKGSFENALFHLSEGDSATIYVSADSLFNRIQQPMPKGVTAGSDLKFIVKLAKIQTQQEFAKDQELKQANEGKIMADYATKNFPNAQKTENGVFYVTQKAGTGISPAAGDTVVVNYTGKLMSGKVFDSSIGKQPIVFPVGVGYVIPGWDQSLLKMKKGEKSIYLIPSPLAYGAQGIQGIIPPFSPLIFEIELLDVKKGKGVQPVMPLRH